MKHFNILFWAIALFFVKSIAAQPGIGFELGTGMRLTVLTNEKNDIFDSKGRLAFSVGATGLLPLGGQQLVLQPSIRFIQKGSKLVVEKNLDFPKGSYFKDNINYIEINPLLQWRFSDYGSGFYLVGGPMIGIGISGKYDYNIKGEAREEGEIEFGTGEFDDLRPLDLGIILGLGYYKYNEDTNRTFFISFQTGMGITDLGTDSMTLDERTLNLMFNMGYIFPLFNH